MLIRLYVILFALMLLYPPQIFAQSPKEVETLVDRLLQKDFSQLSIHFEDSVKVNLLLRKTKGTFCCNYSDLKVICQAVIIATNAGLIQQASKGLETLGDYYFTKENYGEAMRWYIKTLNLEERRGSKNRMAELYNHMGEVYCFQCIFPRSLEYYQKALFTFQELKDTAGSATSLNLIGNLYVSRKLSEKRTLKQNKNDLMTALTYYQRALALHKKDKMRREVACLWANIGNCYRHLQQPEKGEVLSRKAVVYFRKTKDLPTLLETQKMLGCLYSQEQKYDKALVCLLDCEQLSKRHSLTNDIQYLYEYIADVYTKKHNYKQALAYYNKYMILRDSIYNNVNSQKVIELEARYQIVKKQHEIDRLTLMEKQKRWLSYILVILLFLFCVAGFLLWLNNSKKKQLTNQRIIQLEQEKQLVATQSILEGETAERKRVAGDLHDGVGSLLSMIKLKLSGIKRNAIIPETELPVFQNALEMLDQSIHELRHVAHNLMPESLSRNGLRVALTDFCNDIQQVSLHYFGEDSRLPERYEIASFRIIQELVNNALKYSQACQINVQVIVETTRLNLIVSDNGIGFDISLIDTSKTKGINSVRSRVEALSGRITFISSPDKGTEIEVEFQI